MTEERAEQLGELSDRIANLLGAMELAMPPKFHLDRLKVALPEIRDELRQIVKDETGENPWESWEDADES